MLPCYWALLTLLLFFGPFGSEGKKFQRISRPVQASQASKPLQDRGETPRWLPLPADPTPGAEKDSEVTRKVYLTPAFVDQTPKNEKPGDKDLVHQKKEEHILKRRQGFHQVDIEAIF